MKGRIKRYWNGMDVLHSTHSALASYLDIRIVRKSKEEKTRPAGLIK